MAICDKTLDILSSSHTKIHEPSIHNFSGKWILQKNCYFRNLSRAGFHTRMYFKQSNTPCQTTINSFTKLTCWMQSGMEVSIKRNSRFLSGWVCFPSTSLPRPQAKVKARWDDKRRRHTITKWWCCLKTTKKPKCLILSVSATLVQQQTVKLLSSVPLFFESLDNKSCIWQRHFETLLYQQNWITDLNSMNRKQKYHTQRELDWWIWTGIHTGRDTTSWGDSTPPNDTLTEI